MRPDITSRETVLQKPTGGAPRPEDAQQTDRDQALASSPIHRLSGRASRAVRDRVRDAHRRRQRHLVSSLRPFTSAERALPIAVASIVAVAALLAFLPTTPQGAVSGIQGANLRAPTRRRRQRARSAARHHRRHRCRRRAGRGAPDPRTRASRRSRSRARSRTTRSSSRRAASSRPREPGSVVAPTATDEPETAVQDDGTLITGYAPETAVEDGADLIRTLQGPEGRHARRPSRRSSASR